jgi:hypothetical protein
MQFSKELVLRLQNYFREKYNLEVAEDTANEWLDSLAGLYGCFVETIKQKKDS